MHQVRFQKRLASTRFRKSGGHGIHSGTRFQLPGQRVHYGGVETKTLNQSVIGSLNHCNIKSLRTLLIKAEELKLRSKQFAIRIVRLFRSLPKTTDAQVIGKQLLRSGTSVAANYRAVCRARSKAEFIAKIGIVVEEMDETVFWLEMLIETGIIKEEKLKGLLLEANELLAIFCASQRTAKNQ